MTWNWQQPDWPQFSYTSNLLHEAEAHFLHQSGMIFGAYNHLNHTDQSHITINLISDEAIKHATT